MIDPETKTETLADIGLRNGRIVAIVSPDEELKGQVVIDAQGRVVAPGFIDIHSHEGQLPMTMQAHVLDGVTMMIGGNCGGSPYPLAEYFNRLDQDGCLINYAAFTGHSTLREVSGAKDRKKAATAEQIKEMTKLAEKEIVAGGLGISYGIGYVPGTPYEEILALAQVAARCKGMTADQARSARKESNPSGK